MAADNISHCALFLGWAMMKKIGFQKGHGFGGGAVFRHFDGIKVFFFAEKKQRWEPPLPKNVQKNSCITMRTMDILPSSH